MTFDKQFSDPRPHWRSDSVVYDPVVACTTEVKEVLCGNYWLSNLYVLDL